MKHAGAAMSPVDRLARLEVFQAEFGREIAQLRNELAALDQPQPAAITDWIDTAAAAQMAQRSKSRITALCRENRIGDVPHGFARKFGQWRLSRRLFRAWLDQQSK